MSLTSAFFACFPVPLSGWQDIVVPLKTKLFKMATGYNTLWNGKIDPHQIIHSMLIINEDSFWVNLDVFNPFTPKGFPPLISKIVWH